MKLANSSLKKLIKNALWFETDKGYIYPRHLSPTQLEYLGRIRDAWRDRGLFTSSIRIDMMTSATEISFDYCVTARDMDMTIDLYINHFAHSIHRISGIGKGRVEFSLPEGDKQVTIYLPTHSDLGIKNFELDGSYTALRKRTTNTLAIGDSITQGHGVDISSACYVNTLSRKTDLDIISQAIGGMPYLADFVEKVEGVERIIVALGTNYYERDTEIEGYGKYDYEAEVKKFYEKLDSLYPDTPILNITPIIRTREDTDIDRLNECVDIIREECSLYDNITVIDGYALVPPIDVCFIDGLHPSTYGATLYADNLARVIKDIKW